MYVMNRIEINTPICLLLHAFAAGIFCYHSKDSKHICFRAPSNLVNDGVTEMIDPYFCEPRLRPWTKIITLVSAPIPVK